MITIIEEIDFYRKKEKIYSNEVIDFMIQLTDLTFLKEWVSGHLWNDFLSFRHCRKCEIMNIFSNRKLRWMRRKSLITWGTVLWYKSNSWMWIWATHFRNCYFDTHSRAEGEICSYTSQNYSLRSVLVKTHQWVRESQKLYRVNELLIKRSWWGSLYDVEICHYMYMPM